MTTGRGVERSSWNYQARFTDGTPAPTDRTKPVDTAGADFQGASEYDEDFGLAGLVT